MPRDVEIKLLPHQYEFLSRDDKFLLLCGGIGSGKSFTGAHYIIKRVLDFPNALHFIGANSYSQLRDSTLSALFGVLQDMGIPFSYNQNHGMLEFCKGRVLCKTMDNYNMLRGIEIASFWLDEVRDLKQEAFDMIMGRLRDKKASTLQGRLTTSPSGYNYLYDYFDSKGEKNTSDFGIVIASSYANKHLPAGYIDSLRNQYSEKFFRQEILGEFINISTDVVYYAFDEQLSIIDTYEISYRDPICISYDFNIGVGKPMSVALFQYRSGTFYFFDEVVVEGTRTEDTLDEMEGRKIFEKSRHYIVHGDASGNSRSTNYNRTDYDIIRKRLGNMDVSYEIDVQSANPPVRKRHVIVNGQLKNANGITSVKITKNCKTIIKGLKQTKLRDRAAYVEDDSDSFQHVTTALGYGMLRQLDRAATPSRFSMGRI